MNTRETAILAGKSINIDVYQEAGTSPTSAVVVAYGTEGMNPPFNSLIEEFCEATAKAGYLTILPHYFDSTGTRAGLTGVTSHLNRSGEWIDTLAASVDWVKSKKINGGKVAFVGFSLGANIVLNAGLKSGVSVIVDYFGPVEKFGILPMPNVMGLTKQRVQGMPPTLIHHGTKDFIVPDSQSAILKGWLDAHGIECEYVNDYDCGHPGQPELPWTAGAQTSSISRTATFFQSYI